MKRKAIALTLLCVMAMTILFVMPSQAAVDGYIPNGDFSSWGNDQYKRPSDWTTNVYTHVQTEAANPYLYIDYKTGITTPYIAVTPGVTYMLSFRMQTTYDAGHQITYKSYDSNKTQIGNTSTVQYLAATHDSWQIQTIPYTAPEGAKFVTFFVNVTYYQGEITKYWYDDFKLHRVENSPGEKLLNSGIEVFEGTTPTDFSISGTASAEEENVHNGEKALKITGASADVTTTVSTEFVANNGTPFYDISAYVNLTECESDSGVKLELYTVTLPTYEGKRAYTKVAETEKFDAVDKGWRKMYLRYAPTKLSHMQIRVSFIGKGTVYLDDFSAIGTNNLIVNGDLEGFYDDDKVVCPYGSAPGRGNLASYNIFNTISTQPDAAVALLTEENQNHYMKITSNKSTYEFNATDAENKRFCLSFDMKSDGGYSAYMYILKSGTSLGDTVEAAGNGWYHYSYYFTSTSALKENGHVMVQLGTYVAGNTPSYDNLSLVEVSNADTIAILDETGEKITKAENGKTYTVKYEGFGTSEADKNVNVLFALYEKLDDGTLQLKNVQMNAGSVKLLSRDRKGQTAIPMAGEVPLTLEKSFTIPDDGKTYELRAMALDGLTNMKAYFEAITA